MNNENGYYKPQAFIIHLVIWCWWIHASHDIPIICRHIISTQCEHAIVHTGVSIQSLVNPRCVGLHRLLLVVVVVLRQAGLGLVQHRVVNLKLTAMFLLQAPSAAEIYSLPLSVHQVNHETPLPSCLPPSLGMVKSRKERSNPSPSVQGPQCSCKNEGSQTWPWREFQVDNLVNKFSEPPIYSEMCSGHLQACVSWRTCKRS